MNALSADTELAVLQLLVQLPEKLQDGLRRSLRKTILVADAGKADEEVTFILRKWNRKLKRHQRSTGDLPARKQKKNRSEAGRKYLDDAAGGTGDDDDDDDDGIMQPAPSAAHMTADELAAAMGDDSDDDGAAAGPTAGGDAPVAAKAGDTAPSNAADAPLAA